MKYNPDDYEFAIRILHHRKELDHEEVCEWMKHPDHLRILEEVAAVRTIAGDFQANDFVAEHKRLYSKMRRGRGLRLAVAVAASVLVVLGTCYLLLNRMQDDVVPVALEQRIEPGEIKARLILSDGEVVNLAAREQGIVESVKEIIRNDSIEGLKYQLTEEVDADEEYHTLQVPIGGFYRLELSDGTKVWLNAGSELRYPVSFAGRERNVYLQGEGYFEVAKNPEKRFNVHTPQAVVTVLGTSFNVSAYPEEKALYTTLVNGSVCLYSDKSEGKVVLKPGEQGIMEIEDGRMTITEVNPEIYTAWITGRFIFRNMSLETIMRQLQRWYDFQTVYADPVIKGYEFRGVIQRDSKIENVFRAIELATDVKFRINGKQVIVEKK